eukprot:jgi/Hompol1/1634/HPOL_002744-RA
MLSVMPVDQSFALATNQPPYPYAEDATVVYVPTGVGASGRRAIEDLHRNMGRQSHIIDSHEIVARSEGEWSIVEESIVTLTHSDSIDWLLPGVRSTKKQVTLPLVTVLALAPAPTGATATNASRIEIVSKRVYWDQASVLRQIGVLPRSLYCKANSSEVVLPILDASIADPLRRVSLLPAAVAPSDSVSVVGSQRGAAHRQRTDVFSIHPDPSEQAESASRRGSQMPGQPASSIFSDEPVAVRPSSRVLGPPGGASSGIFSSEPPAPVRTGVSIDPRRFTSQISLGDDSSYAQNTHAADYTDAASDASTTTAPGFAGTGSSRRAFAGKTNESQFSFGDDSTDVGASGNVPTQTGRRTYADRSGTASQFSLAGPESAGARPPLHATGRRMNPQSNQSQFSFGDDDQVHTSSYSHMQSTEPRGSAIDETPATASRSNRRDPNARSEEHEHRPSSRVTRAPGGASSIAFGDDSSSVAYSTTQAAAAATTGFDDQPLPALRSNRRDPNARSEEHEHRPSSRVTRAPGGASSVTLG